MLCYNARTMEFLAKLLGSPAKVKIIRLFLFNPGCGYDVSDVSLRAKVPPEAVRREIKGLEKIGLIRKRIFFKTQLNKQGEPADLKRKVSGWILYDHFPHVDALVRFFTNVPPFQNRQILSWLSGVGKIKLVITSGFFIQDQNSRIDLLVVGDHLRKGPLESTIARIESDLGKEIRYVALETEEFQYRLGIYDKLIRDILDYPHMVILDRLGVRRESPTAVHFL